MTRAASLMCSCAIVDHSEYRVQRRADIVAHLAHEQRLCGVRVLRLVEGVAQSLLHLLCLVVFAGDVPDVGQTPEVAVSISWVIITASRKYPTLRRS